MYVIAEFRCAYSVFAVFFMQKYPAMPVFTNVFKSLPVFYFFLLFNSTHLRAQSLNEPDEILRAYEKSTRTVTGQPGNKYWQNRAHYDISVSALPPSRVIKGSETITYENSSPDTLRSIVMKLILNQHRPDATRYGRADEDYLSTGIEIRSFLVNGKKSKWKKSMGTKTWEELPLEEPLGPGQKLTMEIDWQYTIARQAGREGMLDSTTFYLAYFYPRIAVYDDYVGWDKTEFTGGPEFYNDFNEYSLKVSVPSNYAVWATGVLKNADQVLEPPVAARLQRAAVSDSTITIAGLEDFRRRQVTRKAKVNTWHFEASNVSDVALGLSDHYIWEAASVIVDERSGRRAEMHAAYSDTAKAYRFMVQNGRYALNWYSHQMPGVPYPYPKMTAFEGNADMEYPMMINDSSIDGPNGRRVSDHEIAHTWFPFYMGTNETRYAFMDEGWASTLELLIGRSYSATDASELYKIKRVKPWIYNTAKKSEVPIITPSYELTDQYRFNAYNKPSLAYLSLMDLLGEDLFKKCLLAYMDRWKGKHPVPWDFFNTFNDVSGKPLNWFWKNWFFSKHYIDLAIVRVEKVADGHVITIANKGGFAIPFNVAAEYEGGTVGGTHVSPAVWEQNDKEAKVKLSGTADVRRIRVDGDLFLDRNPKDNTMDLK